MQKVQKVQKIKDKAPMGPMGPMGLKAKKSLGQNFLKDNSVIRNIVKMSGVDPNTDVIEIGPGLGAVTAPLLALARTVTAVEIDGRLFSGLSRKFKNRDNFKIINGDILKIDIAPLISENTVIVANLPYYITTPIITSLIEYNAMRKPHWGRKPRWGGMTVMVQLEVAKRICADETSKDYGAISVLCNYYCDTGLLFTVPPEAFAPVPKVRSAVIKLTFRETPKVAPKDEKMFFRVVKAAFSNRRKTLSNCLMNSFSLNREDANEILQECGIDLMARGETLSLENFKKISDFMSK